MEPRNSEGVEAPHAPAAASPPSVRLGRDPREGSPYLNRELSWLAFNARVLAEADSPDVPLFERLRFLGIFASNLDEFFMVRVAGLQAQVQRGMAEPSPDGRSPQEQLAEIRTRVHELLAAAYRLYNERLVPELRRAGIVLLKPEELPAVALAELDERFRNDVFPVLTPIAIDPGHPLPHLRNKSINLGVMFTREHEAQEPGFGVVQVPAMLSRLMRVQVEGTRHAFVLLENVIARHVRDFFPVARLRGTYAFRVTRNWDLELDEEEGEDLLLMVQAELRRRDRGNAVRVEIGRTEGVEASVARLCRALRLDPSSDVYHVAGPLHFADLSALVELEDRRDLRYEPFSPHVPPSLRDTEDLFAVLRERDILLHHPYEGIDTVVDLANRAADDPHVLAIKQTLYRTGGESPFVKALARAAENGKHVVAVVELKARFDEASNIQWARTLEQSGVQVVYGLLGLKTHAKALLVVRREKDGLRRYVHVSTGNYNTTTARQYTDFSLLTADRDLGGDVTNLFNLLTSYTAPPRWRRLVVAPLGLHEAILDLIARETAHARAGRAASILAKMNALVDADVVDALYAASQAGVEVRLEVRGICCLRPGIPGLSERIEVRSIVDRFLEHARVFRFANGGAEEVYLSSADWMPRNFHSRIELLVPVLDPALRERIQGEVLATLRADNQKTWVLRPDGAYVRPAPPPGEPPVRAQQRFVELARERARAADAFGRASKRFRFVEIRPREEELAQARARNGRKKPRHGG